MLCDPASNNSEGKKGNTTTTTTTTRTATRQGLTNNKKNTSVDTFLRSVCGIDTTTSVLCGEDSMLSKVTTLFGAGGNSSSGGGAAATATTKTTDQERRSTPEPPTAESEDAPSEDSEVGSVNVVDFSNNNDANEEEEDTNPIHKNSEQDGGESENESTKPASATVLNTTTRKTKNSMQETPKSPNNGNSNKNDNSASNLDDEEDDLDAMLNNLEIPDFTMSMLDMDDLPPQEQQLNEQGKKSGESKKPWDTVDWEERISREEIFSKRYRPKLGEARELQVMAEMLGLSKSTDLFKRVTVSMGMNFKMTENIHSLFFGQHSILLSILPVRWKGNNCELVLLTDGFVLRYPNFNSYNPLEKRYETCQLWDSVNYCERSSSPLAVTIQIDDDSSTRYELETVEDDKDEGGGPNLDTVLKHLERVITQHDLHDSNNNKSSDRTNVLGWQYLRVRKPAFTAAVANDPKLLSSRKNDAAISRYINQVDVYNRYAPLHYAVLQEKCNPEVIKALLRAGADPNLLDGDERSAMYHGRYFFHRQRLQIVTFGF